MGRDQPGPKQGEQDALGEGQARWAGWTGERHMHRADVCAQARTDQDLTSDQDVVEQETYQGGQDTQVRAYMWGET